MTGRAGLRKGVGNVESAICENLHGGMRGRAVSQSVGFRGNCVILWGCLGIVLMLC